MVFLGGFYIAFFGMVIWGVSMGAQESIMRSSVAVMSTVERRGSAYGIFNTIFGVTWFTGSVIMGLLYSISIIDLVIFSVFIQLISIPFFIAMLKIRNQMEKNTISTRDQS